MIYNGKNIYEALPADSDNYRKAYAEGIQNYINRIEKKSGALRQKYLSEDIIKTPDKFREIYRRMLGINAFDGYEFIFSELK